MLTGCAGVLPLPGGSEAINQDFYKNDSDMKARIEVLQPGMSKAAVFSQLNRHEDHFILLSREEIISAMYGGQSLDSVSREENPLYDREFLRSLSGYKLMFKRVKRKHGVSSPIAMRTNEMGYSYTALFIFKDGILYEKPVLAGGEVDSSSTKTLFDYLSTSMFVDRVGI